MPASPCRVGLEALREAYMRQTIRAAQAEGYQKHRRGLRRLARAGAGQICRRPARTPQLLKGLPKVKVAATWVPWTYGRLSWDSGYGAGIESPGWYDHLWQAASAGSRPRMSPSAG